MDYHSGIKRKKTSDTRNTMNESQRHYVEQNKPDTKNNIQLDSTCKLLVHRHRWNKSVVFKVRCWFPLREKATTGQALLKILPSVVVTQVHTHVKINQAVH